MRAQAFSIRSLTPAMEILEDVAAVEEEVVLCRRTQTPLESSPQTNSVTRTATDVVEVVNVAAEEATEVVVVEAVVITKAEAVAEEITKAVEAIRTEEKAEATKVGAEVVATKEEVEVVATSHPTIEVAVAAIKVVEAVKIRTDSVEQKLTEGVNGRALFYPLPIRSPCHLITAFEELFSRTSNLFSHIYS